MLYKQRRRLYSQNNLVNPKLIAKLIRKSSLGKNDKVIEIGPGRGIITQELLKVAGRVTAIELDRKLYFHLKEKYKNAKNLELIRGDFLNFRMPPYSYKVFSNIPFNITSGVLRKLTDDDNFLEAYIVIQKEAARRFIGMPFDNKNSMVSVLLKPWFEIDIFWNFRRHDFIPNPHVEVAMIRIVRRKHPLINLADKNMYRDYIVYNFSRLKIAELRFEKVLKLFNRFVEKSNYREKKRVSVEAQKFLAHQKSFHKRRN
ncbi:hypothetical protein A2715_03600 [Candidatus Woesebacteria bacterium RIFCSPHIGHO2_01_FULL_39_32]|uniref:Ribosomal RNA adenine methylase transferase N-terminal domain-containing protein n=1 Tax=Candidatus Woesebacteria bacterium RIFCSPLOWO2_01_FULL_39_25 TaxID=1802521 RepID=A0A1F8BKP3_9BACT|nr:MAG: hypothetical protein A2124_04905 [Candidatus Woesebacteria bacterium GWB1_37_5]OGM24825.1 MAG: hypothetical protein A2715_03600 [Candidatus Woesebacteria bacterium RIFCSPHIGHO2_01_FULL_39_32]OGM37146.1 MAG: hypothetical protein A3F01_05540 [Candidatus Woesebacteria bacterium RIFCSPHIGHO2_12_FULL_38_11]OGM64651.1 MAG: hypothetical protein A2893_06515 [Candidatus Woesebacteria bacterium RIFCSPLOWO2_01_FULL_39_25]